MIEMELAAERLRALNLPSPGLEKVYGAVRRRRRRRRAAIMVAAVAAAGGVSGGVALTELRHKHPETVGLATGPTASPGGSASAVTATLHLDVTTVKAGNSIRGQVVVINNTGAQVAIPNGLCDDWDAVGLYSASIQAAPFSGSMGCSPPLELPTGQSAYSVTVDSTYATAGPGPTPLPAGRYQARLVNQGPVQLLNSVTVTVTG